MLIITDINNGIKDLGVYISFSDEWHEKHEIEPKLKLLDESADFTLESAWKGIVGLAKDGRELHLDCFNTIKRNKAQYNLLNSIFIKKLTFKDLPVHCRVCKTEKFQGSVNLKGRYPTLVNNTTWFESDCGWSLQLNVRNPFYGFHPIDEMEINTKPPHMFIGEFMCPACTKERSGVIMDLFAELDL